MNPAAVAEHAAHAARGRRRAAIFAIAAALTAAGAVPAFIYAFSGVGPRARPEPWLVICLMILAVSVIILFVMAVHHATLASRHATNTARKAAFPMAGSDRVLT